jgi:hypothetical protein
MREFDDVPRLEGGTWREITRWLGRHGFAPVKPQRISRVGYKNYTDLHGGSAIWLRRRPGLLVEAVRIDLLGHPPDPRLKDARLKKRYATLRVGWGEPRHVHKEAFPATEEPAYLSGPTPGVLAYSDANVVTSQLRESHIWIQP